MNGRPDAVVIGSGPNGLSAAIELAHAGLRVQVLEGQPEAGGGLRSSALTLPGFVHDHCATALPLAVGSPFFRRLGATLDVEFVHPPVPLAHPLDGGDAVVMERSVAATAAGLGAEGAAWSRLMEPLVEAADTIVADMLGPLRPPRHPRLAARFGMLAVRSAAGLARSRLGGPRSRAMFAGMAAHGMVPIEAPATASFGLVLAILGQSVGWPFARGGSQALADAMAGHLRRLGGEVVTGRRVESLAELPGGALVLADVVPRTLVRLAGGRLPGGYSRRLLGFRHGPAVFKLDWALAGPIPWQAEACRRAGTVHLGGHLEEIVTAEAEVGRGGHPRAPLVLVCQQTVADPSRAPEGRHTAWAYCHVPNGSSVDMTARIEAQVERFAPGFGERVLARAATAPADFEAANPNCVGGDINGGSADLRQLLIRPLVRVDPYRTPDPRLFLCSSSTPPGGGVHGLCGMYAARSALRHAGIGSAGRSSAIG